MIAETKLQHDTQTRPTHPGKPRIMFIEERSDVLHAFERLLKVDATRWNMVFVQTFEQAFDQLKMIPADVVVASIDAARSDDIVALERLKTEYPETVRMVFGAPALRENVVRVAPLCHQYLVKPFDVGELKARLRALLRRVGIEGEGGGAITFYGSSFIADARGDKLAELGRELPGIASATLDLEHIRRVRASMGFFRDRRPSLYRPLTE